MKCIHASTAVIAAMLGFAAPAEKALTPLEALALPDEEDAKVAAPAVAPAPAPAPAAKKEEKVTWKSATPTPAPAPAAKKEEKKVEKKVEPKAALAPAPVVKKEEKKVEKKVEPKAAPAPAPAPVVKEEKKVEPKAAPAPAPAPVVKEEKKVEKPAAPVAKKEEVKPAPAPAAAEVTDEINLDEVDAPASSGKGSASIAVVSEPNAPAAEQAGAGASIAARYLSADAGALIDITSDDAPLTDILRQFRKITGANIVYAESSNLQQRVSVSLKRVPWLQAMNSILEPRGFRVESSGNIHFIKEDKVADPVFTRSFLLNHAPATDLAELFNKSYGVKDSSGKVIKPVATAFDGANTVVVTSTDRVLADCEKIIKAIDKAVPQIYIEARFIELSNQAMHKLGMQWDRLESWGATVKDLSAGATYNNGRMNRFKAKAGKDSVKVENTDAASGNTVQSSYQDRTSYNYFFPGKDNFSNPVRLIDQSIGDEKLGAADMVWRNARVFSGQLSADDFNIAMSAFEKMEDARIFSNPKIIVSNGKQALVDMTTKYPNITLTSQHDTQSGYTKSDAKLEVIPGDDGLFAKTAFFSWGITLTVKPRISPDGLISVEIVPSISELDTDITPTGFYQISGGTDAPYGSYPIIKYKRLTTDFTMKDGATAVIGGLSKTEEGDIDSGIPYLREIPWIGNKLFGWKSRGKVQKEIIVFVTVGIADPADLPEDVGLPKNAVRGREYVERRAQEPGDRKGAALEVLKLDMRSMEQQRREYGEKLPQAK